MQDKKMTKSADLGQGWFANAYDDGSYTIRNGDKGQRIDLSRENAAKFVSIWNEVQKDAYQND